MAARRNARGGTLILGGGFAGSYVARYLGQAATLGRCKGIITLGRIPIRGSLGWFGTLTYHLYQLTLFSRKLRVVTDWTVALFFRRDIVELGTLGHPRGLSDD